MLAMPKYTMRDVARLAGVSIATVSAYINGTAGVSPRLTAKISQAMAALDYHPDQVARSLKVGRTHVIGMIVPDVTNAFFPEAIRGVEDAAGLENYSVILCNSNEDAEQEKRHLSTLFSRRVDGVLLACCDSAAAYDSLLQRRFPIVFLDRVPQGIPHTGVSADNQAAGHEATRHLIQLGHKRIAFIAGMLRHSTHAERLNGFRKAMQESNIAVRDECLRLGDQSLESGYHAGLEMFRLPVPPTAIIASNNRMLLGLMRAVNELKIKCPAQVSIVGFDDFAWTQHFTPPLTVIAQPAHDIGRIAMQMLLERIRVGENNDTKRFENIRLRAELRVRQSTARPQPVQAVRPRGKSHSAASRVAG